MLSASIGILCYNEKGNIRTIVERLFEVVSHASLPVSLQIVIIDNGSTDGTGEVIEQLKSEYSSVSSVRVFPNKGYGYGIRTGLAALHGDIVGYMWGDNQFDAAIVRDMLQIFIDKPTMQFVKTWRRKRYDGQYRLIVSKIYQVLFRLFYGGRVRDVNAGPKLFRSSFFGSLRPLVSNDWFLDAEIMIQVTKRLTSGEWVELPISFYPRTYGSSKVRVTTCFEFLYRLITFRFKQ